jgi:hypothetical protein
MTGWITDELDYIGTADELEITTAREDGSRRRWTPIWVVRVDDDLYVRSYRGADGAWYRHATQHAQGRIQAGDIERDVTVHRSDDTVQPAIGGDTDQLGYHLGLARQDGATEDELIEAITHLAFYAGWPKAMSAMSVAKRVFAGDPAA